MPDVKEGNWIEVLALMNRYQPPGPMSLEIVGQFDTIGAAGWTGAIAVGKKERIRV